jgi:uncharacterized protein
MRMNNADAEKIKKVLSEAKTIAVVGLSSNPGKDSHRVARYLKDKGYKIVPVNPGEKEILGEKSYADLLSIEEPIDIVDVFRRSEFVPEIAEQAIKIGAKVLWTQIGVENDEAAEKAEAAGMTVLQNICIMQAHSRFMD